jgi:hypothetical protein
VLRADNLPSSYVRCLEVYEPENPEKACAFNASLLALLYLNFTKIAMRLIVNIYRYNYKGKGHPITGH